MDNNASGVYQCGKFLVVERARPRFPQQCVWCACGTKGELTPVKLTYMPPVNTGSAAVSAAAAFASRVQCTLPMPVCKDCRAKANRRSTWALRVCLAAWALCGIAFVWLSNSGLPPQHHLQITGAVIGAAGMTIGLIALFVALALQNSSTALMVGYIGYDVIWMRDVHTDFLGLLPQWHGERRF